MTFKSIWVETGTIDIKGIESNEGVGAEFKLVKPEFQVSTIEHNIVFKFRNRIGPYRY